MEDTNKSICDNINSIQIPDISNSISDINSKISGMYISEIHILGFYLSQNLNDAYY